MAFTQQMTLNDIVGTPYSGTVTTVSETEYDLLADGADPVFDSDR